MKDEDIKKNGSGYADPTAYEAIKLAEKRPQNKDFERYNRVIRLIFELCELAGFHVENRIVLKDKKTGRIWR